MEPSPGSDRGSYPARTQACERCWKRKQRCDRLLPSCSACASLGIECTQRSIKFAFDGASGAEESSALTNATLRGYLESLKSVIEQAGVSKPPRKRARRESLASASSSHARGASNTPATRPPRQGPEDSDTAISLSSQLDEEDDGISSVQQIQAQPGTNTQCAPVNNGGDRDASLRASMNGISFLSMDAMAEPRGDGFGNIPQRISTGNLVRAAIALDGTNPAHPAGPDPSLSALVTMPSGEGMEQFQLNRDATESFLALFLDEIALLYPYFDRNDLETKYKLVVGAQNDTQCRADLPSDADRFNAYMAVCIGTLLSPESPRLETFRTKLHSASLDLFDSLLQAGNTLIPVACLVLFTIYATYTPSGGSAWQLLGLTIKQCIFLGLNCDPEQHMHTAIWSEADMATRRCLFWTIYSLDRSLNAAMDRPFLIQDDDISVHPPDLSTLSKSRGDCHPLSIYILMQARILSNIRRNQARPVVYHYSNLQHVREYRPKLSGLSAGDDLRVSVRLEQYMSRSLTFICQGALGVPEEHQVNSSSIFDSMSIEQDISSSCKRFIDLLYDRSDQQHFVGSFVDAYDIFISGVFCICIEQRRALRARRSWSAGGLDSMQRPWLDVTSDMVNKCCTLIAGIEVRFGAVKVFRKALRDYSAAVSEKDRPEDMNYFLFNLPDIVPRRITSLICHTLQEQTAGQAQR